MLKFQGAASFRARLVLATVSGRPLRLDDIRAGDEQPGLREYEASLLRLIEKVTDGCAVEINETGTRLKYKPGIVINGARVEHDCGTSRGIGYFLEPLVLLSLFGKKPLSITLKGLTNDGVDPSVDTWRTVTLPLLKHAVGEDAAFELKVLSRGAPPGGGGVVLLQCPAVRALQPIELVDEGMVKRVRGIAHSMLVAPQTSSRLVDGARGVLNKLLADVFIFTDHMSGKQGGASPGYGVTLVAETTSGCLLSAELTVQEGRRLAAEGGGEGGDVVAEDIGCKAAQLLLEEVAKGGVVDSCHQGLLLTLCALGPAEVSSVRLGPLTPHAVATLRHLRDVLDVRFSIKPEAHSQTLFLTCIGSGIKNAAKRVT
mmetsp:Transcript_12648/g.32515  ORF Transcript_12648/g.32515 Transcript_12648/m.32515 type:complete len:371 (+) Transcript_12648:191-1303(+)|eukprot:jgi/Tetstr1/453908/TSEL_040827.t1